MPIVFSKLANSQMYSIYASPVRGEDGQVNTIERYVHIKGGANLADRHLQTPLGVPTTVTDEEAILLLDNSTFKLHKDKGHVTIEENATERDVDKVVADMGSEADPSAPVTPAEFANADGINDGGREFNGQPTVESNGNKSGKRNK